MQYIEKHGQKVCWKGQVIISGTAHLIEEGIVLCDRDLNRRPWNLKRDKPKRKCEKCFQSQDNEPNSEPARNEASAGNKSQLKLQL